MMDKKNLIDRIEGLLKETETYSFPIFTPYEKRVMLLQEKRKEVNNQIMEIFHDEGVETPGLLCSDKLWNEAESEADEQFEGIDPKQKIRSFYLQEIMHRYVEKNLRLIAKD